MTSKEYTGPRIGDLVQIEAPGTVVELQARDHVAGALVDLGAAGQAWFPLDVVVLRGRRGE